MKGSTRKISTRVLAPSQGQPAREGSIAARRVPSFPSSWLLASTPMYPRQISSSLILSYRRVTSRGMRITLISHWNRRQRVPKTPRPSISIPIAATNSRQRKFPSNQTRPTTSKHPSRKTHTQQLQKKSTHPHKTYAHRY